MSASETPRTDALRKQHEAYMRSGPILATDPDMFAKYSELERDLTALRERLAVVEARAETLRLALEGIIDHAAQYVAQYHAAMAGYRQSRHDRLDAEMEAAHTALKGVKK